MNKLESKEFEKTLKENTLKSVKNIQKAIENNKLVIFVGAGVSKNSGIPTWNELIKEMAKDLNIKAKAHYYSRDDCDCHDYYDSDDYLKIPQYYFNELGEKRYFGKIRNVLKLDLDIQPNEIHRMIFDLNPVHIITTNYDYLLEKQLEKIKIKNREYCKIANDKELASSSLSNYIIKMHGEFCDTSPKNYKKNNIVLKERDYDSYSENFKLIETFVKGLFSTYTVLFVGFSATDSNVRRIFQWIKDIVGTKQKTAYLIDVNDYEKHDMKKFKIKYKYYKKQKIFTLYKYQVENEINDVLEYCKEKKYFKYKEGMNLYCFLYFIKNYESLDVNKYHKIIKQLKGLKFINNDVLEKVFNSKIPKRLSSSTGFPLERGQQRYEIDTFRLKTVLTYPENLKENIKLLKGNSRLSQEDSNIVSSILLCKEGDLSDKNVEKLKDVINHIPNYCPVNKEEIQKIKYINKIINKAQKYKTESFINKFIKHEPVKKKYCKNNPNTVGVFEKAFELYNERKYVESYNVLKEISNKDIKDPVIYFIAELNKKIVTENLKWEKSCSNKLNYIERKIAIESEKINIERIIDQKIPNSIKPVVRMFLIESVENQYFKFIELLEKILDYKYVIEHGGIGVNPFGEELIKDVHSFFNFMLGNYLFVNRYRQTQALGLQIAKAMFESYTTTYGTTGNINLEMCICKIREFDYFVLYIIIEFTTNESLEQLLLRLKIKELKLQNRKKDIKTLIVSFSNYIYKIVKSDIKSDGTDNISNDKVLNFLTIFRFINIDNSADFKDIVYAYIKFVRFYVLHSKNNQNIYSGFHLFIDVVTNNFKKNNIDIDFKIYKYIISQIYYVISIKKSLVDNCNYKKLIIHCFEILKEDKNYKLRNQKIIDFYLPDKAKEDKTKCWDEILIEIYSLVSSTNRKKIKEFFEQDEYKTITVNNCQTISFAVKNGVIEYFEDKQDIETYLFNSIEKAIPQKGNNKSSELFIKLIDFLFCLIKEDKIKNKDKVQELLLEIPVVKKNCSINLDFFEKLETLERLIGICLDPEGYDYSKVQIDDFKYLNTNIIKKMKFNSDGLRNIMSQMIEKSNFKEKDLYLYDSFKDILGNKDKDFV